MSVAVVSVKNSVVGQGVAMQNPLVFQCLSAIFNKKITAFEECFYSIADAQERDWEFIVTYQKDLRQLVDENGRSLLMHAIRVGNTLLSQKLIEHHIYDPLFTDIKRNTLLHAAAKNGDIQLVGSLWKSVGIDATNHHQKTPLHKAIQEGQAEVVQALMDNGANILAPLHYKGLSITPLQYALIRAEIACFDILAREALRRGISLDKNPPSIGSLLHLAVHFQQNQMLDHLLKIYPEQTKLLLESRNAQGNTPFAYAIEVENPEALALLQLRKANIETENNQGRRPLHLAAQKGNTFFIEYLVFLGCQLSPTDYNNARPIDLAQGVDKIFLSNLMKQEKITQDRPPHYGYASPQNLVFKGGGPKGIAYLGVLKGLYEKKIFSSVIRVAGTSAGAINSTLLAFDFSLDETEKLLKTTNLKTFLDHPLSKERLKKAIKDNLSISNALKAFNRIKEAIKNPATFVADSLKKMVSSLWHCTGVCEGDVFRLWIEDQIRSKTSIEHCTFGELRSLIQKGNPFKHLHVFASRLDPHQIVHFNSEDTKWDQVVISDAVRASMSIPAVFKPHTIHQKINGVRKPWNELGQFADGGILYNLPIEAFDEKQYIQQGVPDEEKRCPIFNKRSLGFSLYTPNNKFNEIEQIKTVGDLLKAIFSLYMQAEDLLRQRNPYNQHRIIEIDNRGVGTLDFNLSDERKEELIASGLKAVREFYGKYSAEHVTASLFYYPRLQKQISRSISLRQQHSSFTGRQTELKVITSTLSEKSCLTLYGPGGVGKTELAITFANENLESYSLVWFIPCSNEEEKLSAYIELAASLRIPFRSGERTEDLFRKVHLELENFKGKPWLLIYDGLSAAQMTSSFKIPERGGKRLITSHAKNLGTPFLEVRPFSMKEAQELMTQLTDEPISSEMNQLIEFCSSYPLVLGRVGMDIRRTPGETIQNYLANLSIDNSIINLQVQDRYQQTFEYAIRQTASELPPKAIRWLQACYYLHPNSIPLSFLHRWLEISGRDKSGVLIRSQNEILISLSDHAIQQYEEGYLSMPSLFHRALALLQTPEETIEIAQLVHKLLLEEARWDFKTTRAWESDMKKGTIWSEHAIAFSEKIGFTQLPLESQASIFHLLGVLKEQQFQIDAALNYHRRALFLRREGKQHSNTASSLECIGDCYYHLNKREESARYHQEAVKIREQMQDTNPLDCVKKLISSAGHAFSQGNAQNALTLCLKALPIQLQELGNQSMEVAQTWFLIGQCYELEGSKQKALEYYEKAFNSAKHSVGENNSNTRKFKNFFERLSQR